MTQNETNRRESTPEPTRPVRNYPPGWGRFCAMSKRAGEPANEAMAADLNRFAARYRAARSFGEATFDALSQDTAACYSALCRFTLAFSAFECLERALGEHAELLRDVTSEVRSRENIEVVRELDRELRIFEFVYERLDEKRGKKLRAGLEAFVSHEDYDPLVLARALRHIFVHGLLTPNVSKGRPGNLTRLCDHLSEFLLDSAGRAFSAFAGSACAPAEVANG